MEFISPFADILSIVSAIVAFLAWLQARKINRRLDTEEKRLGQPITIILKSGDKKQELPAPIQRRFLTRAELLGRLGMVRPGARMNYSLNKKEFFEDLDAVLNGTEAMTLVIEIPDSDYQQLYGEDK